MELCYAVQFGCAHCQPGLTDADLWLSNRPIYVAKVFRGWRCAWLQDRLDLLEGRFFPIAGQD
jgi:hypothetical protein